MTTVAALEVDRFDVWGTVGALCVTDSTALGSAREILDATVDEVDRACSRFRPDAEVAALNSAAGHGPFRVSTTLFDLVEAAMAAVATTDGACDPTVLPALVALGYDRDIEEIRGRDLGGHVRALPAPGAAGVVMDRDSRTIELAAQCALDLGAVGKARCADLAAERIEHRLSVGCLVDLGGDLRVSGVAPEGGWRIGVAGDARTDADLADETVAISEGGVASSSTELRRWQRGGAPVHHIVDPSTGLPAKVVFSLATVAASSCVAANALSTAAIVWGEDALYELPQRGAAGRLVRPDSTVERVGGWPHPVAR